MASVKERFDQIEWGSQQSDGQVLLSPPWEIFVLCVSILSVFNLFLGWVMGNPTTLQVVLVMDGLLTVVFASDVIRRLMVATDNRAYLTRGYGWIDVLSTIPLLRIFRLFRVVRVFRVMARMGGPSGVLRTMFRDKASGGLLTVVFIAILMLEFGSLAMLWAESSAPDATIVDAEDSMWYLIVTMSTVGYGDMAPVTTAGRIIGVMIIVVGVGVFGTLTGFLANAFLSPSPPALETSAPADPETPVPAEPREVTPTTEET